jgi:hypothetical protein
MEEAKHVLVVFWVASVYGLITLCLGAIAPGDSFLGIHHHAWPLYQGLAKIPDHWWWFVGGFFLITLIFGALDGAFKDAFSGPWLANLPIRTQSEPARTSAARKAPTAMYQAQVLNKGFSTWINIGGGASNVDTIQIKMLEKDGMYRAYLKNAIAVRVIEVNSKTVVYSA